MENKKQYKSLMVLDETHRMVKILAVQSSMTVDEIISIWAKSWSIKENEKKEISSRNTTREGRSFSK